MDIQTWIAQYAEELWELLKKDNTCNGKNIKR